MKYVVQFFIIALISLVGELLAKVVPLPVPGSIYGLVLMFAALKSGICPVSAVKETSGFLLEIMPVFFIAPAIAILDNMEVLRSNWIFFLVVSFFSTIVAMVVSGYVTQIVIRAKTRGEKGEESK